eukprot:scaffold41083_cov72-Phaeocystis_antarctica.AAC.1
MSAAVAAMAGPYGQERDNMVDIVCCRTARGWVEESEGVVNAKSDRFLEHSSLQSETCQDN